MPEITLFGWFHTIMGMIALISGVYTLAKYKVIEPHQKSGQVFLGTTLIAAVTALAIYRHGGFGPAHGLAVLTLLALVAGTVLARTKLLGKFSPYAQAMSYSALFLFHMIPAITDGLMRLPADNPIVTDIEDPLLKSFYLAFLIIYLIGVGAQIVWLRRQSS